MMLLLLAAGVMLEDQEIKQKEETVYRFNFNSISEERCWNMFRFQKEHILLLKEEFHIHETIHLKNDSVFSGLDAFCIFCGDLLTLVDCVTLQCYLAD